MQMDLQLKKKFLAELNSVVGKLSQIGFLNIYITYNILPVSQTRLKPSPRLKCKSELF